MLKRTLFVQLLVAVLGLRLWIGSYAIQDNPYRILYLFQDSTHADTLSMTNALPAALFYMSLTFVAVILLFTGLTAFVRRQPLLDRAHQPVWHNATFFGLLPHLLICLGWEFIWPFLPIKPTGYVPPIVEIKPLLTFTAFTDELLLYITVVLALLLSVAYAYNLFTRVHRVFSILCGILWGAYFYDTLYITTAYFEYGKWFLLFALVAYLMIGIAAILCHRPWELAYLPVYQIHIRPFDRRQPIVRPLVTKWEEEDDDDFSLFFPLGGDQDAT